MKIKVAILGTDQNYLNRIVAVFNTKYSDKLETYSFTDEKSAMSTIDITKIDVFIAGETFEIDTKKLPQRCGFAYFVDSAEIEQLREQKTIYKFQKADLIYKQILSIYSENTANIAGIRMDSEKSAKLVSFATPCGGVGSSTMAAAFATKLSLLGKRTLYLNMEQFGSADTFFSGEGQSNFGDVIYALKSKKVNLGMKLESTVKKDPCGVFFYSSAQTALNMNEMNEEDIQKLLNDLRISGSYDYIVLDADFGFDKRFRELVKQSSSIVLVSDGSQISNQKLLRAYQAYKILDQQNETNHLGKMALLYNKFSNKTSTVVPETEITALGGVQKFEHATTPQIIKQIIMMSVFDKLF
jgi:cellulose biosynthesis protein BcsQ